jgi:hypothetical protein
MNGRSSRFGPAVAPSEEAIERARVLDGHAEAAPGDRRPDGVGDLRDGREHHPAPGRAEPVAQVDVLDEHEVGGVEAVDGLEGVTPDRDAAAADPVDLPLARVLPVGQPVGARPRVAGPQQSEDRVADGLPQ